MNETPERHILEFKDVSLTYHTKEGETLAVKDLGFYVREGEFMAVIGPSGCGKTTGLSLAGGGFKAPSGANFVGGAPGGGKAGQIGSMFAKKQQVSLRKN